MSKLCVPKEVCLGIGIFTKNEFSLFSIKVCTKKLKSLFLYTYLQLADSDMSKAISTQKYSSVLNNS